VTGPCIRPCARRSRADPGHPRSTLHGAQADRGIFITTSRFTPMKPLGPGAGTGHGDRLHFDKVEKFMSNVTTLGLRACMKDTILGTI
jgi:hypothetical protein